MNLDSNHGIPPNILRFIPDFEEQEHAPIEQATAIGRDFAGMPTYQTPLTWLFFGNENSFFRYRKDLKAMTSILNTEQKEKLRRT